jgi:acyl carrier protein
MDSGEVENIATRMLTEMFGIPIEKIRPEASFSDDFDLDSIDLVDWLGRINDEVGSSLSPYDFQNCSVLQDFLSVLNDKLK